VFVATLTFRKVENFEFNVIEITIGKCTLAWFGFLSYQTASA